MREIRWMASLVMVSMGCAQGGLDCPTQCADRETVCGTPEYHCTSDCERQVALAMRQGRRSEVMPWLACRADHVDRCDAVDEVCGSLDGPALDCRAQPLEYECLARCEQVCLSLARSCGESGSGCADRCRGTAVIAATSHCGGAYQDELDCLSGNPSVTCRADGMRALCSDEMDAFDRCVDAPLEGPPTVYQPCDGACAPGLECVPVSAMSGRICTARCTSSWDCPGVAECVDVDGRTPVCVLACATTADCGPGTYCGWVHDAASRVSWEACVPF